MVKASTGPRPLPSHTATAGCDSTSSLTQDALCDAPDQRGATGSGGDSGNQGFSGRPEMEGRKEHDQFDAGPVQLLTRLSHGLGGSPYRIIGQGESHASLHCQQTTPLWRRS